MRLSWKLPLSTVVFALCIAPTIVSYQSYIFTWDDSDYLGRSIAASRAFWSGNAHALRIAMVSIRPPIMTLLGLPWGTLASWNSVGKCFVTLTAFTAFFVACCLFFLLRIGLNLLYLTIGSGCAVAALGPFPAGAPAHFFSSGFMADSLFAWIAFAATLLIPYEAITFSSSTTDAFLRGVLWAIIFSAGVMTKTSFLYFIVLIVPILFAIRTRRSGLRNAFLALASLAVCSIPTAYYWLRYGLPALENGWAASFGHDAPLFHYPLSHLFADTLRQSPGFLLFGAASLAGALYLIVKRRDVQWVPNGLPLLLMLGYCAIALASSNREPRFLFPGIIAVPFLMGLLIPGQTHAFPRGPAALAAMFVFLCLIAAGVPMRDRANRQSIHKSEEVVAQAMEFNAKRVVLGTDSASLNGNLMYIAIALSPRSSITVDTLAWHAANGVPIEDDYREMRESDLVVFQNTAALQNDPITNQRAPKYEQYIQHYAGAAPINVVDGIRIYGIQHNSQ